MKKQLLFSLLLLFTVSIHAQKKKPPVAVAEPGQVWSVEKANAWYKQQPWITGANYIPATAINQLEMWQAATFDSATIDREFRWAADIGFNTMRVYLHSLAWKQDAAGFKDRMNTYLGIANKHGIKTIFVFFDDCWNKEPKEGVQPRQSPAYTIQAGCRIPAIRFLRTLPFFLHWRNM